MPASPFIHIISSRAELYYHFKVLKIQHVEKKLEVSPTCVSQIAQIGKKGEQLVKGT